MIDLKVLLEQLPTVGDVTVVRGAAPAGFSDGFTWTVTFETQIDNLQPLVVDGTSTGTGIPIVGPDTLLDVVELQRGAPHSLALDSLMPTLYAEIDINAPSFLALSRAADLARMLASS